MAFKRAAWHSGLVYAQTCEKCHTKVTYMDDKLDFRPWYADGFVYCPTCNTPLRHRETYAVNKPAEPQGVDISAPTQYAASFWSGCGRAFCEGENFCPICGNKR